MQCWKCRKEMVEQEHVLPDVEKALQFLTATPLRFWVCECEARDMEARVGANPLDVAVL